MEKDRTTIPPESLAMVVDRQVRQATRPLVWIGTVVELLVAIAAIATQTPAWIAAAAVTAVPLVSFITIERRANSSLREQLEQLGYFDRKYRKFYSSWTLSPSSVNGYVGGTHSAYRELVALRTVTSLNWSVVRRADDDSSYAIGNPTINLGKCTASSRSNGGSTLFPAYFHKKTTTLAYRISFEPYLSPADELNLSFEFHVPAYMPANIESLRRRPKANVPAPGEANFTSSDIGYPIEEYRKTLIIPKSLGTSKHGLQVLLKSSGAFPEEEEHIRSNGLFTIDTVDSGGEECWRLQLVRVNPPLRATYRFYWTPPEK